MSFNGNQLHEVSPGSVRSLRTGIEGLGLIGEPYAFIGGTALELTGYVPDSQRIELVTRVDHYQRLREESGPAANVFVARDLGQHGMINEKLIRGMPGRKDEVHIIGQWDPPVGDLEAVSYDDLEGDIIVAHDMPVIDPVISLKWLLALGYERDRVTVMKALRVLEGVDQQQARLLRNRALEVWPSI